MTSAIFILVAFLASVIGCICGIGGGVIIKPVLDAFGLYSVSTISFMSGCIVLAMTTYSVVKATLAKESVIEKGVSTYLGIGAAVGGLLGKQLFDSVKAMFENADTVGAVQAAALFLVTLGTMLYTINKSRIQIRSTSNKLVCLVIGLLLGIMSSFLGIGGGPINLVVLGYFFGMDSKTAAANSLYIILFSQSASLLATVLTASVPEFRIGVLLLMVAGGIGGGIVGRKLNKKMDNKAVDKLFIGLMVLIVGICVYNAVRAFIG